MLTLILAGLLSLPSLLLILVTFPILVVLSAPAAYLLLSRHKKNTPASTTQQGSSLADNDQAYHVIVTGGSSGIGLCIALNSAMMNKTKNVRKITILARDKQRLEEARAKVQAIDATIQVQAISVDVSNSEALQKAASTQIFTDNNGATATATATTATSTTTTSKAKDRVLLFCCAGSAYPEHFHKLSSDIFVQQVQLNQLGCIYATHAFLPYMSSGTICLCSSAAGQCGVFGLASYSPTKFALRGLAEVLHAELLDTNIHVQVAYPPDTDTPGFARENLTKPKECSLISSQAGLANPNDIAKQMLHAAIQDHPPFAVYFDFDGFLLSQLTCGFAPVTSYMDAVVQLSGIMTFGRWIALFYLQMWHSIIRTCRTERQLEQEEEEASKKSMTKKQGDTTEASKDD